MCEDLMRLIVPLLLCADLFCGFRGAQDPIPESHKVGMIIQALEFRKLAFNDGSVLDACSIARLVGHSDANMKRIADRIGAGRIRGATDTNCAPSPQDSGRITFVQRFDYISGISDSVASSYNLDRNPQNRAGLAMLTIFSVGTIGYATGHSETYTFAGMQDGPGGTRRFFMFLDVKFHHFHVK
jgi:hypothetical protein